MADAPLPPPQLLPNSCPCLEQKSYGGKSAVRAVTVKQLSEATMDTENDSWVVSGEAVQDVTLVGKIVSVEEKSTHAEYGVCDGTGRVMVRSYINSDDGAEEKQRAELRQGRYARVFGKFRTQAGEMCVSAHSMRPVTDFNEVTYHLLEAVYTHLDALKRQGYSFDAAGNPVTAAPGGLAAGAPAGAAPGAFVGGGAGGGGGAMAGAAGGGGGGALEEVNQLFMTPEAMNSAEGLSFDQVVQRLGNKYNRDDLKRYIEELCDQGLLYSTNDDHHFKTTAE